MEQYRETVHTEVVNGITYTVDLTSEWERMKNHFPEQEDAEMIARLEERCDDGDMWAWCDITVTASCEGFKASDNLGCCSFDNKAQFLADDYYKDMKAGALYALRTNIEKVGKELAAAQVVLAANAHLPG